ncbi:hypothetical protein [Lysinibacillus sp. NPDC092081]|uniref:hypothetical protein n=1 Tax=Lysinibacillus sp. NPDC092081 TaxID=3364131 RepID=UPI0038306AA0
MLQASSKSIQGVLAGTPLKSIENVLGLVGNGFSNALGLVAEKIKGIDAKQLGDRLSQGFETVKSVAIPTLGAIRTGLGWMVDNKDIVIAAATGIASGFAAFKTIKTAVSIFDSVKEVGGLAGTFAKLTNPVGIATVAIGGLITAGIYLYQNWDTVKEKALGLWKTLRNNPMAALVAGPIGGLIAAGISLYNNWDTVMEKAGELWGKVTEVFGGIYDWGVQKIQPVTSFFQGLYNKFTDFKNAITSFKLPDWVSSVGGAISGAASKAWNFVSGSPDGSHATGLERVPFDGYVAELHKDEAVLTANQSNALRSAGILSQGSSGTPELNLDNNTSESVPAFNNTDKQNNTPANNGGGHQFVFHITGDNPMDIAQKVREVISDMLDSEMQTI